MYKKGLLDVSAGLPHPKDISKILNQCPRFRDIAYFIWVLPLTGSSMRSMGFEPALRSMRDQRSTITAILAGQLREQSKLYLKPAYHLRGCVNLAPMHNCGVQTWESIVSQIHWRDVATELHRGYWKNVKITICILINRTFDRKGCVNIAKPCYDYVLMSRDARQNIFSRSQPCTPISKWGPSIIFKGI